jgi:two-component system, sensor histidine kinase and response regulator
MQRLDPNGGTQPLHILVADDDRGILRTVAAALKAAGYSVAAAADGAEALAMADERSPDLAIIDLRMPQLDGLEVLRRLKAAAPVRPVLVFSGCDDLEEKIAAFDGGADDFIEKPFYMRELLKRVEAHARNQRATSELSRLGSHADHLRVMASEAAALLAHDLNNGLSVVKANMEYIHTTVGEAIAADEETADAAGAAQRALLRMITLVRNFVDISRMEDAVLRPTRNPANIGEIVRTVANIHLPRRSGSAVDLVLEMPDELTANVDATLVERSLHNLLNNAARYVNRGGKIRVRGAIEATAGGPVLVLVVGNTGPSIPEGMRDKLFEKYALGADRRAQSGMGLYFCRLATEAHGGSIALVEDAECQVNIALRFPCGAPGSVTAQLPRVVAGQLQVVAR